MQPLTDYALIGTVAASALGGIVLCAYILRYGLAPPEEEELGPLSRRRVLVTRAAHTVAAICFAVTALLAVIALRAEMQRRIAADGGAATLDVRALDGRVANIEEAVREVAASVDALVRRVDDSRAPARPASATTVR